MLYSTIKVDIIAELSLFVKSMILAWRILFENYPGKELKRTDKKEQDYPNASLLENQVWFLLSYLFFITDTDQARSLQHYEVYVPYSWDSMKSFV